jgi:hypothetical protein
MMLACKPSDERNSRRAQIPALAPQQDNHVEALTAISGPARIIRPRFCVYPHLYHPPRINGYKQQKGVFKNKIKPTMFMMELR